MRQMSPKHDCGFQFQAASFNGFSKHTIGRILVPDPGKLLLVTADHIRFFFFKKGFLEPNMNPDHYIVKTI